LVQLRVKKLKLSKAATAEILKLDGVSSAQLESAVKAARLAGNFSKGGSRCGGRAGDQAQPKSIVARSDRKA
jgi:hypothetical protein